MTTMEAVRTRSFWLLTGSWIMVSLGIGGVFSLMIPALESYGISRSTAAFGVSLLTLFSLAGRWTFGFLSDVLNPRYVLTLTATLKFIGLLIFANIRSAWMIIPFVLFFSMGFGGDFVVRPTLQANYFGRKAYGTIQGVMSSATTLGGIAAPVFSAWVFDTYGSYRPAFLAVSIFVLLAIPMVLAAKSPLEMREKSVALGR